MNGGELVFLFKAQPSARRRRLDCVPGANVLPQQRQKLFRASTLIPLQVPYHHEFTGRLAAGESQISELLPIVGQPCELRQNRYAQTVRNKQLQGGHLRAAKADSWLKLLV